MSCSNDVLGRVYEYFLGQFALAEGKKGGQFYTRCVVQLLVEMLNLTKGVFRPLLWLGGMFVQSEKVYRSSRRRYNGKARKSIRLKALYRFMDRATRLLGGCVR